MKKRVVSLVLIVMVCLNLAACGAKAPKDVTSDFLSALQKMDDKAAAELYGGDFKKPDLNFLEDKEMDKNLAKLLEKKVYGFDYTVGNETITEDKAVVDVKITAFSLGDAMTKAIQDYLSKAFEKVLNNADANKDKAKLEDEMSKLMTQSMTDSINKCQKNFKKDIKVNLTKVDGKWKVNDFKANQDFVNAISGDMTSALNKVSQLGTEK